MQNGSLRGTSQHHHDSATSEPEAELDGSPPPKAPPDSAVGDSVPNNPRHEDEEPDTLPGPPSKKRKLADSSGRSTPRPISPPWKRVAVDGPTSFIEGGRRKSSRTNVVPLDLLPQSDKRHTRSAHQDYVNRSKPTRVSRHGNSPLVAMASQSETNGRRLSTGKVTTNGTETTSPRKDSLRSPSTRVLLAKQQNTQTSVSKNGSSRNRAPSLATSGSHNKSTTLTNGRSTPRSHRSHVTSAETSPVAAKHATTSGRSRRTEVSERQEAGGNSGPMLPRLRFKVKMPSLATQHPSHVLPDRKYSSFREWIENEAATDDEVGFSTPEAALAEARMRSRVWEAGQPGQLLSKERCSRYMTDPAEEPPAQYSHQDYLIAHALYFKKLLDKERKQHRHLAKLFAQWCAEVWRKRNKHPEDILREQQEEMRQKRKQLVKDLQRQFDAVRAEVEKARLARWEEQRKAEDQLALNKAIKQSTLLFEMRRPDRPDDSQIEESQSEVQTGSESDESSTDETEDESNMSTASESEGDDDGEINDDEGLTAEELRIKYAHLTSSNIGVDVKSSRSPRDPLISARDASPDMESNTKMEDPFSTSASDTGQGVANLDEVDSVLLDDSDEESTDMEDDMGDSDENRSFSDESGDDEASSSDEEGPGLLGFFTTKIDKVEQGSNSHKQDPVETDGEEKGDEDEVILVPNGTNEPDGQEYQPRAHESTEHEPLSQKLTVHEPTRTDDNGISEHDKSQASINVRPIRDASSEPSPVTITTKPSEAESVSSYEPNQNDYNESQADSSPTKSSLPIKTPIPHLLRGTLREYQHFGLDWLAGLYTSNINGILADEMGLGKTIQTIALLAHLAVEHEVWGPHLVVVPTSVMLNWEMEFKKWCPGFKILTYYGSQEERRQKRKGWMDDDRWHVCITSYQLVLQDQQTFKRRNWHYMVLDEAHNIKNFRSQRWQTLLTFKTKARLLLTGTPLQNNLTELWSLLFFLMPSDGSDTGVEGFADLRNFSEWFRRPVEQILEHGRETMDDEAKKVVTKLHTVLRPYILRRLKVDVEKQMPAKFEHVVPCRLSKRQRYLYDGFMSRAQTKETLASGNYLSIINCLMQLRKVCNHPDLFETRPIMTSFSMPRSAIADFEIKELFVRRRLLREDPLSKLDLDFLNLVPISRENASRRLVDDTSRIMAFVPLRALRERQYNRTNWRMEFDGSSVKSVLTSMENSSRKMRMQELERCLYFESKRHGQRPLYGKSLIDFLNVNISIQSKSQRLPPRRSLIDWFSRQSPVLASMILSLNERSQAMENIIQKFAFVTPAAVASDITTAALTPIESRYFSKAQRVPNYDPFHEAQMRLSIAFPDKRLLQYDCGKLQQLDKLLRKLQSGGHRALIFTQMTKMLDILEQFLNIHGHRYLRLDGATKVEQRQMLTERFNNDTRILAFILSSRSGGLGINLTGADTVIFYDLDWNPAMDKQCQDRCHRIGQTRDVHIYRFVSEYTIESNILRKANQKRMLDDVIIQEGEFTTDYFQKLDVRGMLTDAVVDGHDEASAAMDRVLDTKVVGTPRAFEQAEDKEDIDAAKNAEKELEHADDGDFEEGSAPHTPGQPGPSQVGTPMATEGEEYEPSVTHAGNANTPARLGSPAAQVAQDKAEAEPESGHIDDYLLRFMEWNLKDEPLVLPPDKRKRKSRRGQEHRIKRHR
ncbi:adenosinetriphosphatase [Blastomyces dermatitidis ER-3]|uniref:DNA helicase n=1 Tax=Ajellomyces dermatitidis (strain ER-3 / ATCC MYA-2586) TaxID=559297 RepID=A0ABM9YHB5_AJEDR|nr:adenosinetriphosphatase [Blastomyces dermatitidis ER-3]EEQ88412.1 adenosinetriphosphatase [Blastomyces dermatitidis ER-3]